MSGASRLFVLAMAATAAAPTLWAKSPPRHHVGHKAVTACADTSLAHMDLTPHDFLIRPYAPPSGQYDDSLKTAVDLRVAPDGPMVSLGYNRFASHPTDPTGATLPAATTAQGRNSVGALVSYPFH